MSSFPDWIIGVLLITAGSLGNNLGNNLVSLDHAQKREEKVKQIESSRSPTAAASIEAGLSLDDCDLGDVLDDKKVEKKPTSYRITGTLIFVFGNLFTFASFGFGAQSLLASLESIQFVSNLFFAHYIHHEVVSYRMIIATFLIVSGNVLVVIFADHAAQLVTSDDMINLYKTNTIYQGYMVVAFFLWLVTNAIYRHYHHSRVVRREPLLWNHNFLEPFCYATSSAIIGTQAVLNSKCMAILIQVTIAGTKNEFTFWYIYFILGIWLLLVSYWLNRLDKGLELFPPLFIIPVMQVFFVFFAIICGGLYFQEFVDFTVSQFIGFSFGVAMILSGVYGLAPTDMVLTIPIASMEYAIEDGSPCDGGDKSPSKNVNADTEKFVLVAGEGKHSLVSAMAASAAYTAADSKDKDAIDEPMGQPYLGRVREHPEPVAHTSTSSVAVISAALHAKPHHQIHPIDPTDATRFSCPVATKKNRKIVKRKPLELADEV